jgi:hypothetical protein
MKLREVDFFPHGTSRVLNLTHPDSVCMGVISYGVGKRGTFRTGGANTTEISNPTRNPANNQNKENIIILLSIE